MFNYFRRLSMTDKDLVRTPDSSPESKNGVDGQDFSSPSLRGSPSSSCGRRMNLRPRTLASIQADTNKRHKKNTPKEKRRNTECLETIFEEPVTNKNGEVLLTGRKLKRSITFGSGEEITKGKLKKRRERIKKNLGNNVKKLKKLSQLKSMNLVDIRCKLNLLDIDEATA